MSLKPLSRKVITNAGTDEHASYASLKGSGTGNAVPYVEASLNKEILKQ
jgi:hypothetical protein